MINRAGIWTQTLWFQSPSSLSTKLLPHCELFLVLKEWENGCKAPGKVCSRAFIEANSPPFPHSPSSTSPTFSNRTPHYSFWQNLPSQSDLPLRWPLNIGFPFSLSFMPFSLECLFLLPRSWQAFISHSFRLWFHILCSRGTVREEDPLRRTGCPCKLSS